MLKVKINDEWIDDVRFIDKGSDGWVIFTGDWTNLIEGQIQDIKWVENESAFDKPIIKKNAFNILEDKPEEIEHDEIKLEQLLTKEESAMIKSIMDSLLPIELKQKVVEFYFTKQLKNY